MKTLLPNLVMLLAIALGVPWPLDVPVSGDTNLPHSVSPSPAAAPVSTLPGQPHPTNSATVLMTNKAPVELESVKAAQAQAAAQQSRDTQAFFVGVRYGILALSRNPDVHDANVLAQIAASLYANDMASAGRTNR